MFAPSGESMRSMMILFAAWVFLESGRAEKLHRAINVKSKPYSAVCDGITNDSAAIQAALDAGSSGKIPVFIPATCVANTLSLGSNSEVYGRPGSALKHARAGRTDQLLFAASRATNISIHDIELIGDAIDGSTQTVGIQSNAIGVSLIKLSRINVHDFNQNIALIGYGAGNPTVSNVEISHSYVHDAVGTTAGHGYAVVGTGSAVSGVRVHDNLFNNNGRHCVYFANGVQHSSAYSNEIYHGFAGSGAAIAAWSPTVGSPTAFLEIHHNRIYRPFLQGIEINDGAAHVMLDHNYIYDPASRTQCIIVQSLSPDNLDVIGYVTIRKNYCRTGQSGTPAILVSDATDVLVKGNIVEGTASGITAYGISDSETNASRRVDFVQNQAIGVIAVGYRVNKNGASPRLINNRAISASHEIYDGSEGAGTPAFIR